MDAVAYLTYLKEKKISKNAPPKLLIEKVIFFRQTKTIIHHHTQALKEILK